MPSTKVQERPLASPPSADALLAKAIAARTPLSRARHARAGLATAGLEDDTKGLLLRQLYLAHFESQRFAKALSVAEEAIAVGVLVDVCHQDAARAAFALGDVDGAVVHLRSAARLAPTSRRGFHHWTIGGYLYVSGRHGEAVAALERALRWATNERPLYRAHLTLARLAAGEPIEEARAQLEDLAAAPCGQGYGRFVLGMLCLALDERAAGKKYLESFVKRTVDQRPILATSLAAELALARQSLARIAG
jgi:tetratricopeptide (TPR) repeat protein